MTADRWAEIDDVFQEAAGRAGSDRSLYLESRCNGDAELRAEVQSLLEQCDGLESFFEQKLSAVQPDTQAWDQVLAFDQVPPGTRAGEYRIERLIGRGGMGAVYLAHRADGEFDQRVAIKFAAGVTASGWTAERFRQERRILARLEHPNIARLLGGGTARGGAPYLVMEYVDGVPLHQWRASRKPTLPKRLDLFLALCDAVAHAHRSLIVHRDIKPGNILVTNSGEPKLLDFGISKPIDPVAGESETSTIQIMTPAYASPEQLRGDFVTTATDVYSLGAVLYELLSGKPPFEFARATPAEIERTVCETDPRPPSCIPGGGCPRGDLDRIALKAMHKDLDRRYSSVELLAADIRRYRKGLPVSARADTLWYRSGRFLSRHKAGATIAALILLGITFVSVRAVNDARRMTRFYREFRQVARGFLAELPDRAAGKTPAGVRIELARLFDHHVTELLKPYQQDPLACREFALGYEVLGNEFGIQHERAVGMHAESLFYYRRAIAVMEPHYRDGTADQHGAIILGRCHCGSAQILERIPGATEQAREEYRKCLEIETGQLGDPRPGARYVREFLEAHAWTGDHEFAAGRVEQARRHYSEIVRIASNQRGRDLRAPLWEAEGLLRLGRVEANSKRPQSARTLLDQALARLGEGQAASEERKQEIVARLLEVRIYVERGRLGLGDKSVALRFAENLFAEYPNHPLVKEALACAQGL